jgi:hypothetical protein
LYGSLSVLTGFGLKYAIDKLTKSDKKSGEKVKVTSETKPKEDKPGNTVYPKITPEEPHYVLNVKHNDGKNR